MADLEYRPITDADLPFLQDLYRSTREAELDPTGWPEAQRAAFIAMQFRAQHVHYQTHFTEAQYDLILLHGEPIGRLYVDRRAEEIRIIDIALLPGMRGRGIGGGIMRGLLDEAEEQGVPVRIHVERFNPAMHLYERLGFRRVQEEGIYYLMEWRSGDNQVPSAKA